MKLINKKQKAACQSQNSLEAIQQKQIEILFLLHVYILL
jgi:hypothetical protein